MAETRFNYFSTVIRKSQIVQLGLDGAGIAIAYWMITQLYPGYPSILGKIAHISFLYIMLYLAGRYTGDNTLYSGFRLRRLIMALGASAFLTYPFLSGYDTNRIIYLFNYNLLLLLTLSISGVFVEKHIKSKKKITNYILFPLDNKHLARMRELEKEMEKRAIEIQWLNNIPSDKLDFIAHNSNANIIYESANTSADEKESLLRLKIMGARVIDFVDYYSSRIGKIPVELSSTEWLLENANGIYDRGLGERVARLFDLLASLFLAIFLSPAFVLLYLAIKFTDTGPVFFTQERLGKNKVPFKLYKFRSMRVDAESQGPRWATEKDNRVTIIGNVLRLSHLDELPQLINLIKGDITLVGPRPIREHFAKIMQKEIEHYDLRFLVKPGITGWAQIKGPYGSNIEEQKDKFELDLYYIQRSSLLMNLYIILGTGRHVSVQAGFE
jgi:lipopolysaccharide/colanic/teichoic acid biosynthesis glycosyltransferase